MFTVNTVLLTHPITPVRELTIDRNLWYRGCRSDASRLERSFDGKRCCIGFYALACGIPREQILERTYLSACAVASTRPPHEAQWLDAGDHEAVDPWFRNITDTVGFELAAINDDPLLTERVRESKIAELFLLRGNVRVTFVN